MRPQPPKGPSPVRPGPGFAGGAAPGQIPLCISYPSGVGYGMKYRVRTMFFALAGAVALFSCAKKQEDPPDSGSQRLVLSSVGVSLDIPTAFIPVSAEELAGAAEDSLSTLRVEPFAASPIRGYSEKDGKATIIISTLEFTGSAVRETNPMSNIYTYQRNLEDFFKAGEISFEEIQGKEITLLLMAMSFGEGEEGMILFKGLCYKYPEHFFMIDLYIRPSAITEDDAQSYRQMFLSLNIY
jgi:hypothetical protein